MAYTQQQLDELVACPKIVTQPPNKSFVEERGSLRKDMRLTSKDRKTRFKVFVRINTTFSENFSVGLNYLPDDGSEQICLLRCNGPHEGFSDDPDDLRHHVGFHIHQAKAENIGIGLKAEKWTEKTDQYADYRSAMRFFLKECNIEGAEKHFADVLEDTLFDQEETES